MKIIIITLASISAAVGIGYLIYKKFLIPSIELVDWIQKTVIVSFNGNKMTYYFSDTSSIMSFGDSGYSLIANKKGNSIRLMKGKEIIKEYNRS